MKKDSPQKKKSFYENHSWYHRTKTLQEDGTVKYSKKGGFATSKDADKSYDKCEAEFKRAYRAYQLGHGSVHTTFEYYCDVMDENENILAFMNRAFVPVEERKEAV